MLIFLFTHGYIVQIRKPYILMPTFSYAQLHIQLVVVYIKIYYKLVTRKLATCKCSYQESNSQKSNGSTSLREFFSRINTGPILEFPIVLEVRKCAGHIGIKFPLYDLHLIYGILMHISFNAGQVYQGCTDSRFYLPILHIPSIFVKCIHKYKYRYRYMETLCNVQS